MGTYNVSHEEFVKHLGRQLKFMSSSCESFDGGLEDEAARLAVCIRVLVHDTDRSVSLLQHLKMKGKIEYWDSASEFNPNNLIAHAGLTSMKMTVESGKLMSSKYEPALNGPTPDRGSWRNFQWWWPRQPVIVDSKKQTFSRKDLILAIANQDGGAHVDHRLYAAYADLTKFNSIGWTQSQNGISSPFDNNLAFSSVRQIAFEMLKTLEPHFPQFIKESIPK